MKAKGHTHHVAHTRFLVSLLPTLEALYFTGLGLDILCALLLLIVKWLVAPGQPLLSRWKALKLVLLMA